MSFSDETVMMISVAAAVLTFSMVALVTTYCAMVAAMTLQAAALVMIHLLLAWA